MKSKKKKENDRMKKAEKILSAPFAVSGFMGDINHTQSKTLEPKHLVNYQHP